MEELVKKEDFIRAANLERLKLERAAGPLMKLTGIDEINRIYDALHTFEGAAKFTEMFFERMNIRILLDESELDHIPKSGPLVTVSNHPFGAVDGLALLKIVSGQRPDCKLMGNFLLQHILPIREDIIAVNPFESEKIQVSSLKGMRQALAHVKEGKALSMFPSGEVSSLQSLGRGITDRAWQKPALKIIQKSQAAVVPIYFQGANSPLFHLLGLLHPSLRTASLPAEMIRKKDSEITVRIGNPISVKEQAEFTDVDQLGRFLRARTYSLGSALKVRKFFAPRFLLTRPPEEVAPPQAMSDMEAEVSALPAEALVCSQANFDVYVADSIQIPHVLNELGRLREITFREVGEGTNKESDLDEFDLYYLHLFLWDRDEKRIAGAYRLGKGHTIIEKYGKKGFYSHSFFRYKDEFIPILRQSIELGRSFIHKDYQKHRLSLFLLWKGIATFYSQYPEYRYLIGPVSISNNYSSTSKKFMVEFLSRFYSHPEFAKYVRPRKPFKGKLKNKELKELLEFSPTDLKVLDKVIEDIEPAHFRLPVLLKKYIAQNARILAFNVDPDFNFALDGLMIIDLRDVPEETLRNFKRGEDLSAFEAPKGA